MFHNDIEQDELTYLKFAKEYLSDSPILFDIGLNRGEFTEHWLREYPQGRSFGFEPIPDIYSIACANFEGDDRSTFFNYGISDKNQTGVKFYYLRNNFDGMSSLHYRPVHYPKFNVEEILVETKTLDSIYKDLGNPNYIKIDTEGNEYFVLTGADHLLEECHPQFIQFEIGETIWDSHVTFKQIVEYLYSKNYIIFNHKFQVICPENVTEDTRCANYLAIYNG